MQNVTNNIVIITMIITIAKLTPFELLLVLISKEELQ